MTLSMIPNYIFALVLTIFLIRCFIQLKLRKTQVGNAGVLIVGIIIAALVLAMSVYGIIYNIPLSEVQHLIEIRFQ